MSFSYFSTLNYTLANEDTNFEMQLLKENLKHVVSVAGSGSRVLPLFAKSPKMVTCVDLSKEQLYLTELRVQAMRSLDYAGFLELFGYNPFRGSAAARKSLFNKVELSKPAKEFLTGLFEENAWESLLYLGRWEKTFRKLAFMNKTLTGKTALGVFECRSMEEQTEYLKKYFPQRRWEASIRLLGNSTVFKGFLYRRHFPKMNVSDSHYNFYRSAVERAFGVGLARENYFLQILFFGCVEYVEGNTVECKEDVFKAVQSGVRGAEVNYFQGNVIERVQSLTENPADFLSLSDVPSYFNRGLGRSFMQKIYPGMATGGTIVNRYYLHIPGPTDMAGYANISHESKALSNAEKTQMYEIEVMRKLA